MDGLIEKTIRTGDRSARACIRCGHKCGRGFCDCKQRRQGSHNCGCGGCPKH